MEEEEEEELYICPFKRDHHIISSRFLNHLGRCKEGVINILFYIYIYIYIIEK